MKAPFFLFITLLTAATVFGQNSVSISQTGGAGNQASVTQSGEGNRVSISQSGVATDGSKPGNRVSLRVPKGTETTISQRNSGPNSIEISQASRSTAIISQSSGTDQNTITVVPEPAAATHPNRPVKQRNRQR